MRPHDGAVDDQIFKVRIFTQVLEKALPNALARPPPEAGVNCIPGAKFWWQIAPRRACARNPEHGVNEQSGIRASAAPVAGLAWHYVLDAFPLLVREHASNQDRLPQFVTLNYFDVSIGIPTQSKDVNTA